MSQNDPAAACATDARCAGGRFAGSGAGRRAPSCRRTRTWSVGPARRRSRFSWPPTFQGTLGDVCCDLPGRVRTICHSAEGVAVRSDVRPPRRNGIAIVLAIRVNAPFWGSRFTRRHYRTWSQEVAAGAHRRGHVLGIQRFRDSSGCLQAASFLPNIGEA